MRMALTGAGVAAAGAHGCTPCLSVDPADGSLPLVPVVTREPAADASATAVQTGPLDAGPSGADADTRLDGGSGSPAEAGPEARPNDDLDASVPAVCLRVAPHHSPDASAPRPCLSIRPPTAPSAAPQICLSEEIVPGRQ